MKGRLVERRLERRANAGGKRRRKRKIALAASAGTVAITTGAVDIMAPSAVEAHQLSVLDASEHRVPAHLLSASDEMKQAMIEEEGARKTVYLDVAGNPTVGVGHLVTPDDRLSVGDRISDDQILDLLDKDLRIAERAAVRLLGDLPVHQHEFDALVDLIFNVGEGNVSERASPRLNQAIASGDYQGIADELSYHHAAGSKAKGLIYRSKRRANIFMEASYDDPREIGSGQFT